MDPFSVLSAIELYTVNGYTTQHTTQAHRQQKHTNNTQTTQTHKQHTHKQTLVIFYPRNDNYKWILNIVYSFSNKVFQNKVDKER